MLEILTFSSRVFPPDPVLLAILLFNTEVMFMTKDLSAKQIIYDSLLSDIIKGVYPPDYVFNEKALAEKYSVSKSPVRDALIEMCNENILRSIPRYGYEIVQISEERMQEIVDLRVLLECSNLPHVIERITSSGIAALREYVDDHNVVKMSPEDFLERWNSNSNFHKMLYSMSYNEYGTMVLSRCLRDQTRAFAQLYWNKLRHQPPEESDRHEQLLDLICAKKVDEAVALLRNDILTGSYIPS